MKVLLIEDDERVAHFLLRGLKAEGHRLTWESDGTVGYDSALANTYDIIILDLMLPGMDGRNLCQKLRAEGVTTRILMLTALETTADLVKGLRMGADDYLTKPFAFDELTARIEVLGRRAIDTPEVSTTLLQAGPLEFDTQALIATYDGSRIELTSLEYALLEFLITEQDKVVSRSRILQNVWGVGEDPLTNVVDVYIRRLRAKLEPHGASNMIATIRGRGYRLTSTPGQS